jgi:hypothetical protein
MLCGMACGNGPLWRYGAEPLTRRDRIAALWKFPLLWLGWGALAAAVTGIAYAAHAWLGLGWAVSGAAAWAAVTVILGLGERYFFPD